MPKAGSAAAASPVALKTGPAPAGIPIPLLLALSLGAALPAPARAEPSPGLGDARLASWATSPGVHLLEERLGGGNDLAGIANPRGEEGSRRWRALLEPPASAPGGEPGQGQPGTPAGKGSGAGTSKPGSLDFDLLGPPPAGPPLDEGSLRLRRTLLGWHQGVGLAMFALQLATTVVGQLNYDDKFGGANTNRYVQTHELLAYSTLAAFAVSGTLALVAPASSKPNEGFDRVTLHKYSMFAATAMMAAQAVLGIWTQSREGYLNQQSIATAHLALGYATLAVVGTGIGALVF